MNKTEVTIQVQSSISHIGQVNSIQAAFHRTEFMQPDGTSVLVPTITGNAMRGMLRDCAALYMLDKLGIRVPLDSVYMLASGGSLQQKTGKERDVSVIPMLGLFGTGVGNTILGGRVKVGMVYPIVQELVPYLPAPITGGVLPSAFTITQTEYYTRKDDAKDTKFNSYIASDTPATQSTPQQMRYAVETIKAGTTMYWWFAFERATDMQILAWYSALKQWSSMPVIGGKSSAGHGVVSMWIGNDYTINTVNEGTLLPDLTAYDRYLEENAKAIEAVLNG